MMLKVAIALMLTFCCLKNVLSTGFCPNDLIWRQVCTTSSQPTCASPADHQSSTSCIKRPSCRCPADSPNLSGHRCYKSSECPQESLDAPSDSRIGHNFVVPGIIDPSGTIFGMHISALKLPPHWYHGIALFRFMDPNCANDVRKEHEKDINNFVSINYLVPIKLVNLLTPGYSFLANMGLGAGPTFRFIKQCQLLVEDVLDLRRYTANQPTYPSHLKFLLFGTHQNAYISHIPSKCRDYQQVIWLQEVPRGLTPNELQKGLVIEIPDISGTPVINNGRVQDPLTASTYYARIFGTNRGNIEIKLKKKYPLDDHIVNIMC